MNHTQNDRLNQVTSETLIVGVDIGSRTHYCRAFDWRGFELSRRVFLPSFDGQRKSLIRPK
jgi:transposase